MTSETPPPGTFIDRQQYIVSNTISSTVGWFDNFFTPPREEIETNQSFVRVIGNFSWVNRQGFFFKPRVRLRIKVPGLQQRLRLIVSGEEEEEEIKTRRKKAGQSSRTQTAIGPRNTTRDNTIGLQFIAFDWIKSRVDFDVNVRSELEPEAIFRFRQKFETKSAIRGRFTQKGFWREKIGFGEETQFDLEKSLSSKTQLAWNNAGTYSQKSNGLDWSTGLTYAVNVSTKIGVNFQFSLQGPTKPHWIVSSYRAGTQYRHNILRPWFFYEVEPAVDFHRQGEGGFEAVPSITIKFEILFRKAS